MTVARIALFVLLALVCVQMGYFYPKLAQVVAAAQVIPGSQGGMVASHFNAAGVPNGQQTIVHFFGTYVAVIVMSAVVFFGIPLLLSRVPSDYINLPHRDYWLAPERRAQTMRALNTRFNWLGVATVALILVIMQSVLGANLSSDEHLPGLVWVPLGAYLAFAMWWIVQLFAAFRRPG